MPYMIYAMDHPGMEQLREEQREAHRNHLRSAGEKLLGSGALLDDDGETIIGGLSILDTEDKDEAQLFVNEDPYSGANIRKATVITKWRRRWLDGDFLDSCSRVED